MFHLYAQLKIPLVCLSIFLAAPESSTSSPCKPSSSHRSVYSAFSHLPFALYFIPLFLFFLLPSSHRCVSFIGVAVRLRSRVDEEGALGRHINLLSALVLIGGAHSRLAGPAKKSQTLSSDFTNVIHRPTTLKRLYGL